MTEELGPEDFAAMLGGVDKFHMMFRAYTSVGFTEDQALRLLAYTLSELMFRNAKAEEEEQRRNDGEST